MQAKSPVQEGASLKRDTVSLFGNFVAAIGNVAPSSSVALTLALILAFTGLATPFTVLVVGVFMLFIAFAYAQLNKWLPNAGAPYVWLGKSVAPLVGYALGIIAIIGPTLSNIGNITLAGGYTLGIISPSTTFSNVIVWLVAAVFMGLVAYIAIRGISPSIKTQVAIMVFEYAIVLTFVVLALIREINGVGGATAPSWNMFSPSSLPHGFSGFMGAFVVCVWLYAGWEVPVMLGEESKKPRLNPGKAAIMGTLFVAFYLTFLVMVFQGIAPQAALQAHGADILGYAGSLVASSPWDKLLPLAVLSALFATTQMQLNSTGRVSWAMARDKLLPSRLAEVHKSRRTPIVTLSILGLVPMVVLIPYLASASTGKAIGYVITTAGILYTLMYCVIALACVWFYRRRLTSSVGRLLIAGVLPLIGALAMAVAFAWAIHDQPTPVKSITIAIVALAVVGAVAAQLITKSPYFSRPSVAAHDAELAEEEGEVVFTPSPGEKLAEAVLDEE